jgi:hypothetical protein
VVLAGGTATAGKKTPAVTGSQVRSIFTELLRTAAPSEKHIVTVINATLRRNEEARIYHWHAATGGFPPRRPKPGRRPKQHRRE